MPRKRDTRVLGVREVPQLHKRIARGRRQDVRSRGVPHDLPDLARGGIDAEYGVKILGLPPVRAPPFKGGGLDLPDEGLAVLSGGGDERVVVRGPGGVEHGRGVAPREGEGVGEFVWEVGWGGDGGEGGGEGQDREGAAAGGVPVY